MAITRWMALSDTHGDHADGAALKVAREFMGEFKPTLRLHLGDLWDFRWLRRSASEDEKAKDVRADFDAGLELLGWYKPTTVLLGNHDQRLWDLLDHAHGGPRSLANAWIDEFDAAVRGAKVYPYCKRRGIARVGTLKALHGYAHGVGCGRRHALAYGDCMFGHDHRVSQTTVERDDGGTAYGIGCLCALDLDYNRGNLGTLAQQHGFAFGLIVAGRTVVYQARKVGDSWVLPEGLTTRR